MIITSHMQKIIQIYPCLLKLSRKQESVTDGHYYYIPSSLSRGDNKMLVISSFNIIFDTVTCKYISVEVMSGFIFTTDQSVISLSKH
jgi:hypothetical protein